MTSRGPEPFWEAAYRDAGAETFGPPSDEIVGLVERVPGRARVLDLGCGDGRNALFLAGRGHAVDAVDASDAAIRKLRERAERAGVEVAAHVADVRSWTMRGPYDVVIAHGVLHLLERDEWRELLARMRRQTAAGGWNVVAVFTDRLPVPPDLAPHVRGLFHQGELRSMYAAWDVELWRSYVLEDEHPGGIRHRHAIDKIVARRPGQAGTASGAA